jgi:hypothetical protein
MPDGYCFITKCTLKHINSLEVHKWESCCNHTENLNINILKCFHTGIILYPYAITDRRSSRRLAHISILNPVSSLMNIGLCPTIERKEKRNPYLNKYDNKHSELLWVHITINNVLLLH